MLRKSSKKLSLVSGLRILQKTRYNIIIRKLQMFAEIYEHRSSLPLKIYLVTFMLALVVYFPIQAAKETFHIVQNQKSFISKLRDGPNNQQQLPIRQFLNILKQTSYSGKWKASMKQSKKLISEEGKLQMKTLGTANHGQKVENLVLRIFDGNYEQDGYFQIIIDSDSLLTEQKFTKNKVIYQSKQPVVGSCRKKSIFNETPQTRLFINKLKFRVAIENELKIQLLFAGEYDINIISKALTKTPHFLSALFFMVILLIQTLFQIFGILELYEQITLKGLARKGLSPRTILLAMCWDVSQLIVLVQISYINQMNFAIFALPMGLKVLMIFILEFKLLTVLYQDNSFQDEYRFSKYLVLMIGLLVFYLSNLHWLLFVLFSATILVPQIVLNFKLGHKIKYELKSLLKLICPRFLILFYIRLFDGNMFHLKPDYVLCIGCFILILIQVGFLFVQKHFGSRAILPKFLIPERFQSFKFFMNQEENNQFQCSICLASLKYLPETCPQRQQMTYNRVVVTPCKHKFHFYCLVQWMQTRMQCPNCRRILPPIDQQ